MKTWLSTPANTDFPLENIPFGVVSIRQQAPVVASRIGDTVINLDALAHLGFLDGIAGLDASVFSQSVLNPFIALGKATTSAVRIRLMELFEADTARLRADAAACEQVLAPVSETANLLPVHIGDYTDFYSSREHATNVGMMFRDPANALLPNWRHLPIGYHGRASSIVVSGTPVRRPNGQSKPPQAETPIFGASRQLDFELETGFIVGRDTQLGDTLTTDVAEQYMFGMVLFNDWSARDLQSWEYVPLGPFLGKNFASTMSAWVVTMEALDPFRTAGVVPDFEPLPYLHYTGEKSYDLQLEVYIAHPNFGESRVCVSNHKYLYWNMAQQLAHHTVNGCNIRIGDLYASGTISGKTPDSYGSMLELAWRGTKPLVMPDGSTRSFIQDGDTVILRGFGLTADGVRIGFGDCAGLVLPAR